MFGAILDRGEDLAKAEKPEVRLWMLLADECHEKNDQDFRCKWIHSRC